MMKRQSIILLLFALLLSGGVNAQGVNIMNPIIEKIGDNVIVSFDAKVEKVSTNYMLTLTPVLWNGDKEQKLSPIIVIGRNRATVQRRKGETVSGIGNIVDNTSAVSSYKVSVPFEKWMEGVSLRMDKMLEGCCDKEMLPPIAIANNRLKPILLPIIPLFRSDVKDVQIEKFQLSIADFPFVSYIGNEVEPKGLDIYFELDRSGIKESFMDNTNSIRKIREAIKFIKSSHNMELTRISIAGGASPEGTVEHNAKLGANRAKSVIDYFRKDIDPNMFFIKSIGENWDGLYALVESSDMEHKSEVLAIIKKYPINEGREKQLMDLAGGVPYRYMFKEFFPELRRASYLQVYYDIKPDDDNAKIDKASELIKSKNYKEALALLEEVRPTAYTNNLIGVCYMMMEDAVNARIYLQKAIDGGNEDAEKNLDRMNYQRDNRLYNE